MLATNSIPVLYESSSIVLVRSGTIVESGTLQELMSLPDGGVAELVRTANNEDASSDRNSKDPNESRDSRAGSVTSSAEKYIQDDEETEVEEVEEAEEHEQPAYLTSIRPAYGVVRKESMLTLRRASTASFHGPRGKLSDEEESGAKTGQTKEVSEQGKVKWGVYGEYAKQSNLGAVAVYLLTLIGAQTAQIGGSVWLKEWAEANQRYGTVSDLSNLYKVVNVDIKAQNSDVWKYIGIYFAFGVGSAALTVVQTLVLWIFCTIEVTPGLMHGIRVAVANARFVPKASRKLHEKMAIAMFRSPMSFIETTPAGRILNRFSR